MSVPGQVLLCFVPGLNVFGGGKTPMDQVRKSCREAFEQLGGQITFLDFYGSAGNVAVLASAVDRSTVQAAVRNALGKPCAVAAPATLEQLALVFQSWPQPPTATGGTEAAALA